MSSCPESILMVSLAKEFGSIAVSGDSPILSLS